jgi:hypothetical protein
LRKNLVAKQVAISICVLFSFAKIAPGVMLTMILVNLGAINIPVLLQIVLVAIGVMELKSPLSRSEDFVQIISLGA